MRTNIRAIAGIFLNFLLCYRLLNVDFGQQSLTLPSNAKYTNPGIQNHLISIAASQIREDICLARQQVLI